jgi:hypothetical protein
MSVKTLIAMFCDYKDAVGEDRTCWRMADTRLNAAVPPHCSAPLPITSVTPLGVNLAREVV